jgi:hypothetical protein
MSASEGRPLAPVIIAVVLFAGCTGASTARHTERAAQAPQPRAVRARTERAAPSAPAATEQEPIAATALYALGDLPDRFGEVRWPAPPRITREQDVEGSEGRRVVDQPGTRVTVHGALDELVLAANDLEVRAASGARVAHLVVERGKKRIRIAGGHYGFIELPVPAQYVPGPPVFRREWLAEDVTIDGVDVDASDSAFFVRGRRVAILNSHARAERYSIWCGDTGDFQSEDVVIAGNRFESAGPESTVRLVSVRHAVVVDNLLSNTNKHDFRIHGTSDEIVFARNRLVKTGIMVGSMPGDRIGAVWILDNELHHSVPSLFQVSPERVQMLVARGNRIFSDRWHCFVCDHQMGHGWVVADNHMAPYRPAPAAWTVATR